MMTTVNEANNEKTKIPDEYIFRSFFRSFDLLLSSMNKWIDNQRTCKFTAAYLHAHEQLRLCFCSP